MKISLQVFTALISGMLIVGCGKEQPAPVPQDKKAAAPPAKAAPDLKATAQQAPPPPPAPGAASAPATVEAAAPEEEKLDAATIVLHATQSFLISKERAPKDLQELVQTGFLKKMPDAPPGKKIIYDPQTGEVKLGNK